MSHLNKLRPKPPLYVRFWKNVNKKGPDDHWLWVGKSLTGSNRYGQIWSQGRHIRANRASWELHNGPIPNGLWVLHKCSESRCVNPAHLYLGTQEQNEMDKRKYTYTGHSKGPRRRLM